MFIRLENIYSSELGKFWKSPEVSASIVWKTTFSRPRSGAAGFGSASSTCSAWANSASRYASSSGIRGAVSFSRAYFFCASRSSTTPRIESGSTAAHSLSNGTGATFLYCST